MAPFPLLYQIGGFLVIAAILVAMFVVGARQIQHKAEAEDRQFLLWWLLVLISTFAIGGIVRTVQQATKSAWLDGFVAIFLGLYLSLWGVPVLRRTAQGKMRGLQGILGLLLSLLVLLAGLGICWIGVCQILGAMG